MTSCSSSTVLIQPPRPQVFHHNSRIPCIRDAEASAHDTAGTIRSAALRVSSLHGGGHDVLSMSFSLVLPLWIHLLNRFGVGFLKPPVGDLARTNHSHRPPRSGSVRRPDRDPCNQTYTAHAAAQPQGGCHVRDHPE